MRVCVCACVCVRARVYFDALLEPSVEHISYRDYRVNEPELIDFLVVSRDEP